MCDNDGPPYCWLSETVVAHFRGVSLSMALTTK